MGAAPWRAVSPGGVLLARGGRDTCVDAIERYAARRGAELAGDCQLLFGVNEASWCTCRGSHDEYCPNWGEGVRRR